MPRFGLGFRTQHYAELLAKPRGVDWLEVLSDNFLGIGGPRRTQLERLRAEYLLALHGVSLGIANDASPRSDYVAALRALADQVQPVFVSDHLCWTGLGGVNAHDLLPVAATREVLALVAERVARVQDALGRRLLLENASAYVRFAGEELSEAELLAALCERTGCGVLLDVNNLYVNALNLGASPYDALATLAPRHVAYLHVAGHARFGELRIDTHGAAVPREVWELFEHAARRFPTAGVMLERDDRIPPLAELVAELDVARERWRRAQSAPASALGFARTPLKQRTQDRLAWSEAQRALWSGISEPAHAAAAERALSAHVPVARERGLRVYSDAYAQLAERALATNFPALARVLSRRDFAALCAAYLRVHPSRSHDYLRFGAELPSFIEGFPFADAYAVETGALADIARLEQAQLEAQDAADGGRPLTADALAALPAERWATARFRFAASLRVVCGRWDVLAAVQARGRGERPPLPKRVDCAFLVARARGVVQTQPLALDGAGALEALAAGATFEQACGADAPDARAVAAARALLLACSLGALLEIEA
jgi:hypothetical protein